MEVWKTGDVIYRGDVYKQSIEPFKIKNLHRNASNTLVANAESLFVGQQIAVLLFDNKNEDVTFTNVIYTCDVNRAYKFLKTHNACVE